MASTKISNMPAAAPLSGAELVPVVQSGVNKKTLISSIKTYLSAFFGPVVWDSGITYHTGDIAIDRGGTWQATGTNTNSRPIPGNTDWTLVGGEPYVEKTLTPAQVRTLYSAPVVLVPAVANVFFMAGAFSFVGEQGSVPYDSPPAPVIGYSSPDNNFVLCEGSTAWDGSAKTMSVCPNLYVDMVTTSPHTETLKIGAGLAITSQGPDVTGGDAPMTVRLYYVPMQY